MQHLRSVLVPGDHASIGAFTEEVEEAVGGVAIVPGEGKKRELAVPVKGKLQFLSSYRG